jgi:cytochrome c biogenesis protein CcdA/thiol-disulfide isomerase/thioredoxin
VVLLLGIALLAGVITAVSPCVLPVLPIVLAGGAVGGGRRPLAIVAGLVVSFTTFTLAATALLEALGLPDDLLRNLAIALLFVVAATLLVPRLGVLLERPLAFMTRRRSGDLGGGFLLGVSLGLVFVPCAGPVLATISVLAAQRRVGLDAVLLTFAYAVGAGLVLLAIALGGQRIARRLRASASTLRIVAGVAIAASAVAIVFNLDTTLQTRLGSYTSSLQRHVEETHYASKHLASLRGGGDALAANAPAAKAGAALPDYGAAPDFIGIDDWINSRPLSITDLRGKVVLVDFWTYSCINCLRTLPHLKAWYAAYHKDGLQIVGVHTPEFAFEHVVSNVRRAAHELGVTWPVAIDDRYATWDAYRNEYWPAEYILDRRGHLRDAHFGEGDYGKTEQTIRTLLAAGGSSVPKRMTGVADLTPTELATPETYLGAERLDPARYVGRTPVVGKQATYAFGRTLPQNAISYAGRLTIQPQYALAGPGGRLRLHFRARDVYVVLGGSGRVHALVDGRPAGSLDVDEYRLYTAYSSPVVRDGVLELRFAPGVRAYSFTFG